MRKCILFIFFIWYFNPITLACVADPIDPVCSVLGFTHTDHCSYESPEIGGMVSIAYTGICETVPIISQEETDRVHSTIVNHLTSLNYLEEIEIIYYNQSKYKLTSTDYKGKKGDGRYFIREVLFPLMAKYIAEENEKVIPNTKKIAVINEAARVILDF